MQIKSDIFFHLMVLMVMNVLIVVKGCLRQKVEFWEKL